MAKIELPNKTIHGKERRDEVTCFRVPKKLKADIRFKVQPIIDSIIEEYEQKEKDSNDTQK